jgi:tetratricopeptide (TPR) repeat protein
MKNSKSYIKISLICNFIFILSINLFSQESYKNTIYVAFIHRDMNNWENVIHTIELAKNTISVEQKLELINYYYGYTGYLIGKKEVEKAERLIEKGEKLINQVLHDFPKNATALSFKGSFLGFEVATNKYKAIFIGLESKNYVNKALALDPNNIQAIIDKGNILYYAPKLLGGDKKEALVYFLKGARILEKNNETDQNWVYLNLLSIIASAYEKTDKLLEAKLVYEKILSIEPNIGWIKNDLYPNLLAKIKT